MRSKSAAGDTLVFSGLVVLMILVCYLSWFTWFASNNGGGLLVFGLYFAPLVHSLLTGAWLYSRKTDGRKVRSAPFLLWGGLFVFAYVVTHQFVAVSERVTTGPGVAIDVWVLNLLGVAPVLAVGVLLLEEVEKYSRLVVPVVIGCLLIDALLTLRLLQSDPMAAKKLTTGDGVAMLGATGASAFYIVNAAAILLPALILRAVQPRGMRWWVPVAVITVFVLWSGFLLTMVTATLAVLGLGFFASRQARLLVAAVTPLALVVGLNMSLLAPALYWLSGKATFYEVSVRLRDLGDLLSGGGADAPSLFRIELYKRSWAAFTESPLTGVFAIDPHYALSGHSTALDVLGGMGLLGFVILVLAGMNAYKLGMSVLETPSQVAGLRAVYLSLAFLALVNPIMNQAAITFSAIVVAPMLLRGSSRARSQGTPLSAARRIRASA